MLESHQKLYYSAGSLRHWVRPFLEKSSSPRFLRFPTSIGKDPDKELCARYMNLDNVVMENSSLGVGPERLLWERSNTSKGQLLRLEGIAPLIALVPRRKIVSFVRLPKVTGMGPDKALFDKDNLFKFLSLLRDAGITPLRMLRVMISSFKLTRLPIPSVIIPAILLYDITRYSNSVERFAIESGNMPWSLFVPTSNTFNLLELVRLVKNSQSTLFVAWN
ncbi:hypothetical protein PVAP13_1NG101019 [Panicum virgatum]|uniref:Uncharacterized protein n=1 Tax=Panicum virgatum TaxID=38727 RepID=A0A8T0WX74_PANVG|nr:hypothetical protein PVAP13_1NG101019 [Panicum virgatum]